MIMLLRNWVLFFLLTPLTFLASHADTVEPSLKAMSFNIRYGTAADGDNAWPHRRELLMDTIRTFDPDILGLQEALRMQLEELTKALPEYAALGVGRDADGGGEYSSILYRRSRFDVSSADTFWLSDTPSEPGSTSWGNHLPRICTWARLFDRKTGRRCYIFNTHWDHKSQPSRERAARLIGDRITAREANSEPYIVMGDFNAGEANPARAALAEAGLRDAFRDLYPDAATVGTFNSFRGQADGEKIDAVLVSQHWKVLEAAIDRTERDGRTPSDHFPVTANLRFKDPQ